MTGGFLLRVPDAGPRVALTLDDGPLVTDDVLEVLAAHGARATFFLIGERAQGREDLLARVRADGHEIGNHGWRDEPARRLAPEAFEAQLLRTEAVLGPARHYRPGSGLLWPGNIRIAERNGYRCVLGWVYPFDPHLGTRPRLIDAVGRCARPGSIIILHERPRLAAALDRLLPRLSARGLAVVSVAELLYELRPGMAIPDS